MADGYDGLPVWRPGNAGRERKLPPTRRMGADQSTRYVPVAERAGRSRCALLIEEGWKRVVVEWNPAVMAFRSAWRLPPRDPGWDGYTGWHTERIDTGHRTLPCPSMDEVYLFARWRGSHFHYST